MHEISVVTPVGRVRLLERDDKLVAVEWGDGPRGAETPLLAEARRQLDAYFAKRLRHFDLPVAPAGSAFQKRVCAAMSKIPFGETRSYGELAASLGSSARAVGGGCGRNPLPIIVPCHRVLAANRAMGGYSGAGGLSTKRFLLALEGVI